MKIGIDFDDTIVETSEKVKEYLDRYKINNFNNDDEKYEFYCTHIENITKDLEIKKGAKEILDKLSINNELYIITARSEYYNESVPKTVLEYIKKKHLPIRETYFNCYIEGKAAKCKELGIDLFIDDCVENCLAVSKLGIDILLFGNEYESFKTVNNWDEILEYVNSKNTD